MYNMDISIFGYKLNLEVLILIGIIYLILVVHTVCGTCNVGGIMESMKSGINVKVEGFAGANTNYGESSKYSLTNYKPINTSSWSKPDLRVFAGQPLSPGVKAILDRPAQPVPLPPGELDMFANTPFKPECCPNTYSQSTGCACMTTKQYNYLVTRGGNNEPYSEY
jgi:hypothetical protein